MSDESTILIETAQSVAHDFIDAIIRLKASERILQDRVDSNSNSAIAIIQERQRQIETLTSQVIELQSAKEASALYSETDKEEIEKHLNTIASLEETRDAHYNSIISLKTELTNRDNQLSTMKATLDRKQDELIEKEASLKAREEAILALNHKLGAAIIYGEMKDTEIDNWALEEKKLKTEIEALISERDKLQKTVTSLTAPTPVKKKRW